MGKGGKVMGSEMAKTTTKSAGQAKSKRGQINDESGKDRVGAGVVNEVLGKERAV
jgi:hypothetical protein